MLSPTRTIRSLPSLFLLILLGADGGAGSPIKAPVSNTDTITAPIALTSCHGSCEADQDCACGGCYIPKGEKKGHCE